MTAQGQLPAPHAEVVKLMVKQVAPVALTLIPGAIIDLNPTVESEQKGRRVSGCCKMRYGGTFQPLDPCGLVPEDEADLISPEFRVQFVSDDL